MPLAITEDHRALADVAKAMVAGRSGTAGARRILLEPKTQGRWWLDDGLWKEIVSTGWLGLHVDAQFGGEGYGLPELTIVLEQLGRAAIGGPFLPTVAASAVIAEAGTDEQRRRWLPGLTSGDIVAGIGTTSDATRSESVVTANAVAALAESAADIFLIPVGDDLVLVESGRRHRDAKHRDHRPGHAPDHGAGLIVGSRRRRVSRGRSHRGPARPATRGRRGSGWSRRLHRDGDGLCGHPRTVRTSDRLFSGRQAPLREHAGRHRTVGCRHLGCCARQRFRGRIGRDDGRGARAARLSAGGVAERAGARRHRLHVGTRRPPVRPAGQRCC